MSGINDFEHHVTFKGHVNSLRLNRASGEWFVNMSSHCARFILQQYINSFYLDSHFVRTPKRSDISTLILLGEFFIN